MSNWAALQGKLSGGGGGRGKATPSSKPSGGGGGERKRKAAGDAASRGERAQLVDGGGRRVKKNDDEGRRGAGGGSAKLKVKDKEKDKKKRDASNVSPEEERRRKKSPSASYTPTPATAATATTTTATKKQTDGAPPPAAPWPPRRREERGRIFDETTRLAPEREAAILRASEVGRGEVSTSADPAVEGARLEAVSHLCYSFEKAVAGHIGKRWGTAFEELMMCHDRSQDPLLPADAAADAFLRARLTAAGASVADVEVAVRDLVPRVKQARHAVQRAAAAAAAGAASAVKTKKNNRPTVDRVTGSAEGGAGVGGGGGVGGDGERVKMSLRGARVEIRAEHYEKLRRLFALNAALAAPAAAAAAGRREKKPKKIRKKNKGREGICEDGDDKDEDEDEDGVAETDVDVDVDVDVDDLAFESAAFSVLCRYTAAQGGMHRAAGGHHTALHGAVFDALHDGVGVEAECFASPLNCRWLRYCSAFPDTDAAFGSLGSFFGFRPREGCFEVNPPFEEALVLRCAAHVSALLDEAETAGRRLSFAVVTPHWPGRRAWEALAGDSRATHAEVVPLREHGYFEGTQHAKRAQYRLSSCDTSVVFLQTSAGARAHRVTREAMAAMRDAFRPMTTGASAARVRGK